MLLKSALDRALLAPLTLSRLDLSAELLLGLVIKMRFALVQALFALPMRSSLEMSAELPLTLAMLLRLAQDQAPLAPPTFSLNPLTASVLDKLTLTPIPTSLSLLTTAIRLRLDSTNA